MWGNVNERNDLDEREMQRDTFSARRVLGIRMTRKSKKGHALRIGSEQKQSWDIASVDTRGLHAVRTGVSGWRKSRISSIKRRFPVLEMDIWCTTKVDLRVDSEQMIKIQLLEVARRKREAPRNALV